MQTPISVVFPGQGSQALGMFDLTDDQTVRLVNQASSVLGYDLKSLVENGPKETLDETVFTQPAVFVAGMAKWQHLQQTLPEQPLFLAGHSLGEYTALVAAGVMDFETGLTLVKKRAQLMQDAGEALPGAMAAVIGLDNEAVVALCQQVSPEGAVVAANFNSPAQVVVSGKADAVDALVLAARPAGARLAKHIPVSVASHCFLMQTAAKGLEKALNDVVLEAPKISVINNVDVKSETDPDRIKDALVRQLCQPVRWVDTVRLMANQGVKTMIECGPGRVLTGLAKRTITDIELQSS
jgi:[acyl-carrier-protein] S-malonyltransferase